MRGTAAAVRVRGVLSFPGPDPAEEPGLVDDHVWVDARGAAAQAGGGRWPAVLGSADVLTLTGRIGCPAAALEHWPGAAVAAVGRAGGGWAVQVRGRPPVHLPGPLTPWQAAPLLSLLHTWAAAGSAAGGPVPQGSLPPAGTPVLVLPPAGERGRPAFTAQAGPLRLPRCILSVPFGQAPFQRLGLHCPDPPIDGERIQEDLPGLPPPTEDPLQPGREVEHPGLLQVRAGLAGRAQRLLQVRGRGVRLPSSRCAAAARTRVRATM
ncbi:hypothetical protein ACFQXA_03950 [Nocardiopsis composta]